MKPICELGSCSHEAGIWGPWYPKPSEILILFALASWIKRYHLESNKIWRKFVDYKYDLSSNILWAEPNACSPFWKGVMWAVSAAKHGFRWVVG